MKTRAFAGTILGLLLEPLPVVPPTILLARQFDPESSIWTRVWPLAVVAAFMIAMRVIEAFFRSRNTPDASAPLPPDRRWIYGLASLIFILAALDRTFVPARARWRATLAMGMFDWSQPGVCRLIPHSHAYASDANDHSYRTRINAQGYRGPDHAVARAHPDDIRVELFGDSMIFGIGVDDGDTLADQLELELRAAFPGRGVEVLNFGIPCTSMHTSLLNYRTEGRKYLPDAVLFSHPTNVNPHDICNRIRQIRGSTILNWMSQSSMGIELLNEWQTRTHDLFSEVAAERDVREGLQALIPEQRERGMVVVMFEHWAEQNQAAYIAHLVPASLQVLSVVGAPDSNSYSSRWAIPGDGHPTAAGQHYFAGLVARALTPALRAARESR